VPSVYPDCDYPRDVRLDTDAKDTIARGTREGCPGYRASVAPAHAEDGVPEVVGNLGAARAQAHEPDRGRVPSGGELRERDLTFACPLCERNQAAHRRRCGDIRPARRRWWRRDRRWAWTRTDCLRAGLSAGTARACRQAQRERANRRHTGHEPTAPNHRGHSCACGCPRCCARCSQRQEGTLGPLHLPPAVPQGPQLILRGHRPPAPSFACGSSVRRGSSGSRPLPCDLDPLSSRALWPPPPSPGRAERQMDTGQWRPVQDLSHPTFRRLRGVDAMR
jgi:hypothetical protein